MKTIAFISVIGLIVGGIIYDAQQKPAVYEREVETVVEQHPDAHLLENEEALQAAKDVVKRQELEQKESELVGDITALQEELDAVRKELGTF